MSDKQVAIGSDERRKIARKLCAAAVYLPDDIGARPFPSIIHVKRGNELRRYMPERTCRDVGSGGKFVCSKCGASLDYEGHWDEPTYWVDDVTAAVEYCPNCRARVIYDD